jgi:SRSO17 transposase
VNYYSCNDPLLAIDQRAGGMFRARNGKNSITNSSERNNRNDRENDDKTNSNNNSNNSSSKSNSNTSNSINTNSNRRNTNTNTNTNTNKTTTTSTSESLWVEVRDVKHNTSFIFIAAQLNHPVHDHSAEGTLLCILFRLSFVLLLYSFVIFRSAFAMRSRCSCAALALLLRCLCAAFALS